LKCVGEAAAAAITAATLANYVSAAAKARPRDGENPCEGGNPLA
jgi:hypothetical protein